MTYPTNPITISYSYSDFQLGQGNNNFPGTQIDADLALITNGLNSLNTFVRGVTRSDGKLANQSVGPDQLSSALLLGFTLQGPWVSGFSYSTADGVVYNGNFYRALFAHVSAAGTRPDLSPATWQFLYSVGSVVGAMTTAVYDPQNKQADAFARANHTGTQAISTVSGLAAALGAYGTRNVNYTALPVDNNAEFRFTVAATVSLTAAATLGAGWAYTVIATGGDVVIDPNAAETINGFPTLIVPNGTTAKIICDGANFFTVFKPSGWQTIEKRVFTNAAAITFINLGAYSSLRFTGRIILSADGVVGWRSSTNNGSSYDAGASDYSIEGVAFNDTVVSASRTASSSFGLISAGLQFSVNAIFNDFNVANGGYCTNTSLVSLAAGIASRVDVSNRANTIARNALQLLTTTAVTASGYLTIEGLV